MNLFTRILSFFGLTSRASLANPAQWMYDFFGGRATASGVTVNESTALTHAAVYACVKVLAETIASLPVALYKQTDKGSEKMVSDPRHLLISAEPSELYHSYDFRVTMMLHLLLHGNAFARIIRNGRNMPDEYRIIEPAYVTAMIDESGQLWYKVANERLPIRPRDIIHLKGLSSNGIMGKSPIETFKETIGLGISTTTAQGSLWKNGAMISGYLKYPIPVDPNKVADIKEKWATGYSGAVNAGKTPILDNGAEFIPLSMKPADAMFLETAKLSRNDICAIYRVPPHMISDLERSTNNNIEHQGLEFVRNTVLPYLKGWEMELNRKSLFEGEKGRLFYRFNVDGLLRGDTKSRAEYFKAALGGVSNPAWMTPNEVRELENMNRVEGGDTIYSPVMNAGANESNEPNNDTDTDNELQPEPNA